MSIKDFFHRKEKTSHLNMYEFPIEYTGEAQQHNITYSYVIDLTKEQAFSRLKKHLAFEGNKFIQLIGKPAKIEISDFDQHIQSKWPEFSELHITSESIKSCSDHVYLLPSIEIRGNNKK